MDLPPSLEEFAVFGMLARHRVFGRGRGKAGSGK